MWRLVPETQTNIPDLKGVLSASRDKVSEFQFDEGESMSVVYFQTQVCRSRD